MEKVVLVTRSKTSIEWVLLNEEGWMDIFGFDSLRQRSFAIFGLHGITNLQILCFYLKTCHFAKVLI